MENLFIRWIFLKVSDFPRPDPCKIPGFSRFSQISQIFPKIPKIPEFSPCQCFSWGGVLQKRTLFGPIFDPYLSCWELEIPPQNDRFWPPRNPKHSHRKIHLLKGPHGLRFWTPESGILGISGKSWFLGDFAVCFWMACWVFLEISGGIYKFL